MNEEVVANDENGRRTSGERSTKLEQIRKNSPVNRRFESDQVDQYTTHGRHKSPSRNPSRVLTYESQKVIKKEPQQSNLKMSDTLTQTSQSNGVNRSVLSTKKSYADKISERLSQRGSCTSLRQSKIESNVHQSKLRNLSQDSFNSRNSQPRVGGDQSSMKKHNFNTTTFKTEKINFVQRNKQITPRPPKTAGKNSVQNLRSPSQDGGRKMPQDVVSSFRLQEDIMKTLNSQRDFTAT